MHTRQWSTRATELDGQNYLLERSIHFSARAVVGEGRHVGADRVIPHSLVCRHNDWLVGAEGRGWDGEQRRNYRARQHGDGKTTAVVYEDDNGVWRRLPQSRTPLPLTPDIWPASIGCGTANDSAWKSDYAPG